MVHTVERYKILLQSETNPRVRDRLTGMIRELQGRAQAAAAESETATIAVTVETGVPHGHIFPM